MKTDTALLLVGSYMNAGDGGLRAYAFDTDTSDIRYLYDIPVGNASYMAVSAKGVVYAVTESDTENSLLTAFRVNSDGATIISRVETGANSPCYVAVTPGGRFVVTANYGDGSIAVFPIKEDGAAGECSQRIVFSGSGPFPRRQDCSRIHCVSFTPDNRFMLINDLGGDCIYGFRLLTDSPRPIGDVPDFTVRLQPGSGPRHIVFNRSGDTAYLINEISDTVVTLRYDGNTLAPLQYIRANTAEAHGAGDICLSADGRHLFASLRLKNDGIATFRVSDDNGMLTYVGHTPTGKHPRNIHRHGNLLAVSCKDSGQVEMYAETDGRLSLIKTIAQPMSVFSTLIETDI